MEDRYAFRITSFHFCRFSCTVFSIFFLIYRYHSHYIPSFLCCCFPCITFSVFRSYIFFTFTQFPPPFITPIFGTDSVYVFCCIFPFSLFLSTWYWSHLPVGGEGGVVGVVAGRRGAKATPVHSRDVSGASILHSIPGALEGRKETRL